MAVASEAISGGVRVDRLPAFWALILITGTAALSTDTYVAALPQLQSALGTSQAVAQLTMTACIAGMALGQLLLGPVSDARGRRTLVVGSTIVFTLMSVVCALATDGWLLVGARLVQGVACGACTAIGRAVVTDAWAGREAAAKFGTLSAVSLIAPVIGPVIGGLLLSVGTWRTIFGFLGVVGVTMVVGAMFGLPETLPPQQRQPGGVRQLVHRARSLMSQRNFAVPVLVQCLTVGGFFIYIGGSSFVLQHDLGISEGTYTLVFAGNAVAMMVGSLVFRVLVVRLGTVRLRRVAMVVQTAGVLALATVVLLTPGHRPPLAAVWACLCAMTLGLGLYFPANAALTQEAGRRYAGTASALGGGIPFLVGALTTPLTGLLGSQTVVTMAVAMAVFFVLAGVLAVVARQDEGAESADESGLAEPH